MSSASIQPESSLQAVENSSAAGSTDISFGDGVGEVLLELSKCEFSSKTMSGPDTEEFNCDDDCSSHSAQLYYPEDASQDAIIREEYPQSSKVVAQEPPLGSEYLAKEDFERYMEHFIFSLQKELSKPNS